MLLHIYPVIVSVIVAFLPVSFSIKCYQCSTSEDPKGKDLCGAYEHFDTSKNTPVDCLGEQAVALGTFCYKRLQQSPRGFIWDGRWRSVERRCAQISERGINWGCDWGYDLQGVYWEECYCAEDGCNSGERTVSMWILSFSCVILAFLRTIQLLM